MTTRQFIRYPRGAPPRDPIDVAAALREAFAADGVVELLDHIEGGEPSLLLVLRASGPVIRVLSRDAAHLGTFVDPLAAVAHGLELVDRDAAPLDPPSANVARRRRQATGARS